MNLSRRSFLFGGSAVFFVSGCRTAEWLVGTPNVRFGVVSDIHITTPESAALFEKSLRYFKERGVDAVMVPGDLTDWGLKRCLSYVAEAWRRVFAGTDVVPLFCTGNHDYDGWWYGDMAVEMHANGYSEKDAIAYERKELPRRNELMAAAWREVFGEPFAPVRLRSVRGYDFVSCECGSEKEVAAWMAENGARLKGDKPFFYFQHYPIRGTTGDSNGWGDGGAIKPVLDNFPNAIAFTGHTHQPFIDERQIWQGAFTVLGIPSLSYLCFPSGTYENGSGDRGGKAKQTMPKLPLRCDLRGGQGFVVNVYDERLVVERVDLEEGGVEGASAWVVPLGTKERPFDYKTRAKASAAPAFPKGARLTTDTRNTENRRGFWTIVMNCTFPAATMPEGGRVHHYTIAAVTKGGKRALTKRFLSPAYAYLPKYEPEQMRFWFDVGELPKGEEFTLEARAVNSFGKASEPLVSRVWKSIGEPKKEEAKKEAGKEPKKGTKKESKKVTPKKGKKNDKKEKKS